MGRDPTNRRPGAATARPRATTVGAASAVAWPRSGRIAGVGEAVAHAEDGEQIARRVRLRLELATDVLHMGVDRALVRLEGDAMHRIEELGAREHASRLAGHRGEELELRRGELDPPPGRGDPHARDVELEVAGPADVPRRVGGLD